MTKRTGITAGIASPEEAEALASSAADEFYCGLPGLRSHRCDYENLKGFAELAAVTAVARRAGKRVFLAVNENYREHEYPGIAEALGKALALGAHGAILRDLGLAAYLKSRKLKAYYIMSMLGACYNPSAFALCARAGFSRVTLPEHLSPAEAVPLLRNRAGLETEVFLHLTQFCRQYAASCRLYRCFDMPQPPDNHEWPCRFAYSRGGRKFAMSQPDTGEMLGMLHGFCRGGAGYIKLARTGPDTAARADLVRTTARLIELALAEPSSEKYAARVRREFRPAAAARRRGLKIPAVYEDNTPLGEFLWNTL